MPDGSSITTCGSGELGFLLPEDRDDLNWRAISCCAGAGIYGVDRCTCWEPVYDQEQAPPLPGPPVIRTAMCHDCAYRRGSKEREEGILDGAANFWCHQGVRRVVAWVHPDGRRRDEPYTGAYEPPIAGTPYRADGRPGERCAGWAKAERVRP